jgi:hypothetical protein
MCHPSWSFGRTCRSVLHLQLFTARHRRRWLSARRLSWCTTLTSFRPAMRSGTAMNGWSIAIPDTAMGMDIGNGFPVAHGRGCPRPRPTPLHDANQYQLEVASPAPLADRSSVHDAGLRTNAGNATAEARHGKMELQPRWLRKTMNMPIVNLTMRMRTAARLKTIPVRWITARSQWQCSIRHFRPLR